MAWRTSLIYKIIKNYGKKQPKFSVYNLCPENNNNNNKNNNNKYYYYQRDRRLSMIKIKKKNKNTS